MNHVRSLSIALSLLLVFALSCSDDSTTPPTPPAKTDLVGCADDSTLVYPGSDSSPRAGDISTWAGDGMAGYDGDGHDRVASEFYWPMDIEFTAHLGVFVTDWNNHRIRRLDSNCHFQTVVGRSSDGDGPDGGPGIECELNHPTQVFERTNRKLVIVCWHNHKLREWDPGTGTISVLMGGAPGCTGDGLLHTAPTALLNQPPHAIEAIDGSIYINDQRDQCIRKIAPNGIVSTVVSTPQCPTSTVYPVGGFSGDNGPPAQAMLAQPTGSNPNPPGGGLAIDDQQRLYIADTMNQRIRRVDFNANVITTVAGNGVAGYGGDNGDPLLASLNMPLDITFGPDGRLYIADMENNRIRAVDFNTNVITTVAGSGTPGYSGDGGPAVDAELNRPYGIGFGSDGHLYIADTYNQRIRRVQMHN
jgi:sugar lactone lactonase YvrE